MGMNMTRRSLVKAAAALALTAPITFGGCATNTQGATRSATSTAKGKSAPLTVYLWDTDLIRDLAPWLHEQMPDTEIQFIAGNNDVDLYSYFLEHDELPDIITVRRFAGTEARDLRPHLIDFASYDIVSEFSSYSLQYYKNDDGEINWLPICGIPQTIIANKTLFDEHGLSLPQNYEEYAAVCQAFYDAGIKPYALDLAEDWSSHEMIQAGGIGELNSLSGITWRAQAESAQADISFDDTLWNSIFAHTSSLLADSHLTQEDLSIGTDAAMQRFVEGKAAMFHGSPVHLKQCQKQMDAQLVRVPYFSQTSNEGYVYMTPSLHVAMNRNLADDQGKLKSALTLLDHLVSAEGQRLIANGSSVISFNPAIASLTNGMAGLESEIENNQFYIRYSAQASFDASVKAVKGLLTNTMDEAQAYAAFRETINSASAAAEATVTFECDYALFPSESGNRDAASSILTTVRQERGAQLAFAPYYYFTSPIHAGPCTSSRVSLMIANKPSAASLYAETMTGTEIKELVARNLAGAGGDFCPASIYELPIASGMKIVVQNTGDDFALKDLLVDGSPIDEAAQYSVLLTDGVLSGFDGKLEAAADATLSSAWAQAMASGLQPAQPENYIEVQK